MKILIDVQTRSQEQLAQILAPVLHAHQVIWYQGEPVTADYATIDVVMTGSGQLVTQLLALPHAQLQWVQTYSAGVDRYPLKDLKNHQVKLSNASGVHAEPIAESVLGMILAHNRGLTLAARQLSWQKHMPPLTLLHQQKVMIFGTGAIGQALAHLLEPFAGECVGINHSGHPALGFSQTGTLETALKLGADAQVVVNTLPLTSATEHYFAAAFFEQLTQHPFFVNVGRGPSVVTADLVAALAQHQVNGAGLDVTDPEPLPADHPLWRDERVLITPHIAGRDETQLADIAAIFSKNLAQFIENQTLCCNQVDLTAGY